MKLNKNNEKIMKTKLNSKEAIGVDLEQLDSGAIICDDIDSEKSSFTISPDLVQELIREAGSSIKFAAKFSPKIEYDIMVYVYDRLIELYGDDIEEAIEKVYTPLGTTTDEGQQYFLSAKLQLSFSIYQAVCELIGLGKKKGKDVLNYPDSVNSIESFPLDGAISRWKVIVAVNQEKYETFGKIETYLRIIRDNIKSSLLGY